MDIEKFIKTRPFLYHLSSKENLKGIRRDRALCPANDFLEQAQMKEWYEKRRLKHLEVHCSRSTVWIRDQAPLHAGKIEFLGGWKLENLVKHLNQHVFFWPGTEESPVKSGKNHFARYRNESTAILKVSTRSLIECNKELVPLFCEFNSGAPRTNSKTGYSPRGPETFKNQNSFIKRPSEVVEVVFKGKVNLPSDCLVSEDKRQSWSKLLGSLVPTPERGNEEHGRISLYETKCYKCEDYLMRKAEQYKHIFCLEGLWEQNLKINYSVKPVLSLLNKHYPIKYTYGDCATVAEFKFYINKWIQKGYSDYPILYLAFHGKKDHIILSAKEEIKILEVAELLRGKCKNRIVVFSSCGTLNIDDNTILSFIEKTGCLAVCGYKADVYWIQSTAFDLLLLQGMQDNEFSGRGIDAIDKCLSKIGKSFPELKFKMVTKKHLLASNTHKKQVKSNA